MKLTFRLGSVIDDAIPGAFVTDPIDVDEEPLGVPVEQGQLDWIIKANRETKFQQGCLELR
mgnify:CR=1 FL=1